MSRRHSRGLSAVRPSVGSLLVPGYVVLWLTKLADILTTVVGLELIPGLVEMNPLARAYMGTVGTVPGLLLQGGAVVIGTTLVVEYSLHRLYFWHGSETAVLAIRGAAYGTLSVLYGLTAIHNTQLIVECLSARVLFGV